MSEKKQVYAKCLSSIGLRSLQTLDESVLMGLLAGPCRECAVA